MNGGGEADGLGVLFGATSLLVAFLALVVAYWTYVVTRRQSWAAALLQVADRLELPELRRIRHEVVYKYPRDYSDDWAAEGWSLDETRDALTRWGAEMDLLGVLFFGKQVDRKLFFELYGDVVIRSAFMLAPFVVRMRVGRGGQFWLLFQKLTKEMIRLWSKLSRRRKFPAEIRVPGRSDPLNVAVMENDALVRKFLGM